MRPRRISYCITQSQLTLSKNWRHTLSTISWRGLVLEAERARSSASYPPQSDWVHMQKRLGIVFIIYSIIWRPHITKKKPLAHDLPCFRGKKDPHTIIAADQMKCSWRVSKNRENRLRHSRWNLCTYLKLKDGVCTCLFSPHTAKAQYVFPHK